MARNDSVHTVDMGKAAALAAANATLNNAACINAAAVLADDDIKKLLPVVRPWVPGEEYAAGEPLSHGGGVYIAVSKVTAQAHQEPGGEGMLAVYRPIDAAGSAGTIDDPIPYLYGMDCAEGLYYSNEGKTYLCKSDMPNCVWAPGTAGLWQWEEVRA